MPDLDPPWVWDEELLVARVDESVPNVIWTEGSRPQPIQVTPLNIELPKWARGS